MALEIIETIKATESKAEELKRKALADGKEMLKLSEKQNEEYYEAQVLEARKKATGIIAGFEADAEKEQQNMHAEMQKQIGQLKKDAGANMDAAVKYLTGRFD